MSTELDALLGSPDEPDDEPEELRYPRRLKTRANILQAMRWVSRQMLAGKIPGERGLATMRALRLLLDAIDEVGPEAPEVTGDVRELAKQRRRDAIQLEQFKTERGLSVTPEADPDRPRPRTNQRQTLGRGAEEEGEEIREALELAEPEEIGPTSTAEAILRDNPGIRSDDGLFAS